MMKKKRRRSDGKKRITTSVKVLPNTVKRLSKWFTSTSAGVDALTEAEFQRRKEGK